MLKIRANDMMNTEKNLRISRKGKETRARREMQEARIYKIKFDKNKISNEKLQKIKRLFLEGKWFTNYMMAKGINELVSYKDYKIRKVEVKVKDAFENRELNILSSQMKEYLITRLQSNTKTIQTLNKSGHKTGKMKYMKALHSIPLMQYNNTYYVNKKRKIVRVQGLGDFKAIGLNQMPDNSELTAADLIERNGDYFIHVTAYTPKEERVHNKKAIGIDFGIKNQAAFSNGIKVQYAIPVSERIKSLSKAFSRAEYNEETKASSKRRQKLRNKMNKEFEHQNRQKIDINNKIAHYITANYQYVAYQNDCIHAWEKLYGRRIYQTAIGGLRDAFERKANTPTEVGRFVKTTGVCMNCGKVSKLNLSDRVFECPFCK